MTTSSPSYKPDPKAELRRVVLARRRTVHAEKSAAAAAAIAAKVAAEIAPSKKNIAGYWPIGDELDCRPALEAVLNGGGTVGLPVVAGQGQVLIFRDWFKGDTLEPGPFGTAHPSARAAIIAPDILLLPLVAYDKAGHRLGYGAGYYDRTISALRAQRSILAVGLAFDEQEIDAVPAGQHDQKLDAIITDRRVVWFNSDAKALAK